MLITLDMDPDQVARFERMCDDNGIQIDDVVARGPAGGCPCYRLTVDGRAAFQALGKFYYGAE